MLNIESLSPLNIKVYQDSSLYCFTSDSILLSEFATAKSNDVVADFCSGSGIVGFDFYSKNSKLIKSTTFFEMQKCLYDLSVKSIELNKLENKFFAINSKLQDIDKKYYGSFSLVLCNPPYMKKGAGEGSKTEHIATCKSEVQLSLSELILSISKCLKFGGRCDIVHRADRLVEIIDLMKQNNIEPKKLQFVCPKKDASPYLLLIEGVKGGKSGIKILPSIIN
ncbi:MAG: methyltransferase [Clostridia bacterium]|nr:methyltransferase [Clostridia bacterium]